ncbi:hypothetical protein [Curtobacterium sp. MCPF17_052]|uniref:hypothetical protein n=1 Tax=Curtobacterium sp. MCPF17_052 TaxID=2175655 RepID=UPI0024DF7DBE|nr:hypothetical protein [Curtobacterium sp. MCPF17_052]WIB13710.1 hypothetical protein DEJ36_08505 [Curtobacterium sp. MCPF17_052]
MTDECIHGFPIELCDICSPRQRDPEDIIKTPTPRRTRVTTSLRSTPSTPGGKVPEQVLPATRDFGALRAHHVTHIDNLPGIVADGAIVASDQATPAVDVSSAATREARAAATAPRRFQRGRPRPVHPLTRCPPVGRAALRRRGGPLVRRRPAHPRDRVRRPRRPDDRVRCVRDPGRHRRRRPGRALRRRPGRSDQPPPPHRHHRPVHARCGAARRPTGADVLGRPGGGCRTTRSVSR